MGFFDLKEFLKNSRGPFGYIEFFAHLNEFYQMANKPGEVKHLDVKNSEICHFHTSIFSKSEISILGIIRIFRGIPSSKIDFFEIFLSSS